MAANDDDDDLAAWILDYPGQIAWCPYAARPCDDGCYVGFACDQIIEVIAEIEGQ